MHSFYVRLDFEGGSHTYVDINGNGSPTKFKLEVKCDSASTTISEQLPPGFSRNQTYDVNLGLGFKLPSFVSSNAQCPKESFEILQADGSPIPANFQLQQFQNPTPDPQGLKVVFPTNDSEHFQIQFKVRVTAKGGRQFTSPNYTFIHGCPREVIEFEENPATKKSMVFEILQSDPVDFFEIKPPSVWPEFCKFSYSVEQEFAGGWPVEGYITKSSKCNPGDLCEKLTLQLTEVRYFLFFRIRTTLDGGFSELSSPIKIQSLCSAKSAVMTAMVTNTTFAVLQFETLRIPSSNFKFSCRPADCCTNLYYTLEVTHQLSGDPALRPATLVSGQFDGAGTEAQDLEVFTGQLGKIQFSVR